MVDCSQAVEEQAVRDVSAAYSVEAGITTSEDVPPGYNRTEVGVIPEDWNQVSVAELAKVKGGKRLPKGHSLIESPTPHPYIRVADLLPGKVDGANIKFVPEKAFHSIQNYRIYKNDLFISVAGTLGLVGAIPSYLDGANLTENADRITDIECNRGYLMYWLMSEPIQRAIESIRTVGAQPKLALGRIANFEIAIPPTPDEQRAIATALSDADALIESLDRLIAKKRAIKRAAMQQLLTGQTRLPGFTGEWETKQFGQVLERRNLKSHQIQTVDYRDSGNYPVVDQGQEAVVGFTDQHDKVFLCPKTGVIVFGDHTCIVKFVNFNFAVGADGTQVLEAKPGQCTRFYGYQLEYDGVQPTGYNRHFKFLKEKVFTVPERGEQAAIATVLSDMDTEIEALERRRDKARQLKQGMMQQLLTGRVRLVAPQTTEPAAC